MAVPDGMIIREATEPDQATIRYMVRQAGLDPTSLHWSHFLLAEVDGQVVGIGQMRPSGRELGSMVVLPGWRGQGIGGAVIKALQEKHGAPLYLEARGEMAPYYARFGFRMIPWYQTRGALRAKSGIGSVMAWIFGIKPAVMRWDG